MTSRVRYLVNVAPGISLSALNSSVIPKLGGDSEIPGAWDISTAVFSQSFSVSAQETFPTDVFFKPDGTKMYTVGYFSDTVDEYDLSTAWDISTATYLQSFDAGSQESAVQGIFFKSDGLKMYVTGQTGDDVNEYDLSTAWDISTAVFLQSFSVSSQDTAPNDVFFKSDGLKMYVVGATGDDVNEYNLSAAWDVSTATYLQNFSVSAQHSGPTGVFFKPDGTKMYISGYDSGTVSEYDLSTAWDISTATYLQSFDAGSQESSPTGVFFKPDGTKLYVVGPSSDDVHEYDLGT